MSDSPAAFPVSTPLLEADLQGRIAFIASSAEAALEAQARLVARYGDCDPDHALAIVALGGDGLMLETQHRFLGRNLPIYGMNRGSVGFLMNDYREDRLPFHLAEAQAAVLHPLRMVAHGADGTAQQALAINEVSLLRETRQAAKIRILIDGKERLEELVCDGVLVSTPAGSTAYNLSAHGPIVPLGANLLPLTPISAFRPRRWRGALLHHSAQVRIEVLDAEHRAVSCACDNLETRDIRAVEIREDSSASLHLLFNQGHALDERILREQFNV